MAATKVTDSLSNAPEQITAAAEAICKSKHKFAVFDAVYFGKKKVKSVAEIAERTGLDERQVLNAGIKLRKAGFFEQTKTDGKTAYVQDEFFHLHKNKILKLAKTPKKITRIPTKRTPRFVGDDAISFVRKAAPTRSRSRSSRTVRRHAVRPIRVAFLTTNPDRDASLRTDIEAREVQAAITRSPHRDKIEFRHFPATRLQDLLNALNDFRPNILHFSGHGGGGSLLFDNETPADDGGLVLDFGQVNRVVSATDEPPIVLVLNACESADGAKTFLNSVSIVIAMSDSILDSAACLFSGQFYSAIGGGQSIGHALEQGRIVMEAANLPDADFPVIIARPGLDVDTFRLAS